MASKKREVQLQAVINNQSLWDEMLQNKGLTGKKKADNIVTLQPLRDKCEPVFLFSVVLKDEQKGHGNGKIIAKIQGANAPLVSKKVVNLIDEERKIAAGEMARPQYPEIPLVDSDSEVDEEALYQSDQESYSIAIIKPDAVISRKGVEIKRKIIKAGCIIEAEDKIVLTEEQVVNFYSRMVDQPDFEEFVSFMTSGLSYVLVLSQRSKHHPPSEETEPQPDTEPHKPSEDQPEVKAKVTAGVTKKKRDRSSSGGRV
ncbi:Thioredoxin domain-containing protein 3 [Saguinus oedipus]|uniref:Thioredoxin domain-containing protein 3 n=1 Tax=Saguinus oedipus TaxID=9490 RepID=A0ABQ9UFP5_SAGOE|nr:Thioredoxin domain-containing protein 3 [Saguinus oedipus]